MNESIAKLGMVRAKMFTFKNIIIRNKIEASKLGALIFVVYSENIKNFASLAEI